MKRLAISLILFSLATPSIVLAQMEMRYSPNQLVVKLNRDVDASIFDDQAYWFRTNNVFGTAERFEISMVKAIRFGNSSSGPKWHVITLRDSADIEVMVKAFLSTGYFEHVEPNYVGTGAGVKGTQSISPNDAHFNNQYALVNDGSFTKFNSTEDADIDMDQAWEIEQGDTSVIVSVLDAGMSLNHPEIRGRLWTNKTELKSDNRDNDQNGYIDDIHGWDFANDDSNPTDDHGHGTNVTGIIAANGNNGIGYAGVDWNCKIMTCKVLNDNNWGLYTWWSEAIIYSVDNGAKVINMSLGGASYSKLMEEAVDYAYDSGVTTVVSMMNFNSDDPFYPAAYDNTIAVGATNPDDTRCNPFFWSSTSGSCYGSHINLVAPGNYMYGLDYDDTSNYNSYWGGTSQAAPLVTGVAALLIAKDPDITPDQIRQTLEITADDQVGDPSEDAEGWDQYFGFGRLNAHAALALVAASQAGPIQPNFTLYPNPVEEGVFTIELPNAGNSHMTVSNSCGMIVHSSKHTTSTCSVEIDDMDPGIYFVRIDQGHQSFIRKVVVQ